MVYRVTIGGFEDYGAMYFDPFQKAHTALVQKYAYLNPSRKKLRELWKQIYNITVIIESDRWCAAEFESEKDYVAFILKWS